MKYFIVNLWTSIGPKVVSQGYETEQEAVDFIAILKASGVKGSQGQLAVMRLTA